METVSSPLKLAGWIYKALICSAEVTCYCDAVCQLKENISSTFMHRK